MVNLNQKILETVMKKNLLSQTRKKFDEVETRIIELENAILEFSNSN